MMGAGMSVIFDAAFRRFSEEIQEIWVAEGTLGFILFMAGFGFFGSSIRYMVHMDRIVEYSDRKARSRSRHPVDSPRVAEKGRGRGNEVKLKRIRVEGA